MKSIIILSTVLIITMFGQLKSQELQSHNNILLTGSEEKIISEIKRLKELDTPGAREQMNTLYKQLGSHSLLDGEIRQIGPGTVQQSDNPIINAVKMYNGSVILGNSTATMFRDSLKGTIVNVVAIQGTANSADTIKVFWSKDNGISWELKDVVRTEINGGHKFKINTDEIDCEIIENSTGGKFLYVVFGGRDIENNNIKRIGLYRTNLQGLSAYGYLNFPGMSLSQNVRVYKPKLCSDNHQYANVSYVYIIVGVDSVSANGRPSYNRLAVLTDPYNLVTPGVSFNPNYLGSYNPNPGNIIFEREADIAYIKKGATDSIIIGQSAKLPDSSSFSFSKYSIYPPYNAQVVHDINGISLGNNNPKSSLRISTNSADNGVVFVSFREKNNNIWRPRFIRNTAYGNFYSESYYSASQYYGSTTGYVSPGSVYGMRGSSTFYFTFSVLHEGNYSLYHYTVNGVSGSITNSNIINPLNTNVTTLLTPVAGVRLVNSDSCYTVWSELGPQSVWASLGCTGAVIQGISNQNSGIPQIYSLSQNYPNPFNPVTNIKFSIPKSGNVRLVVYDAAGKQVAELVNEQLSAGTYKADFNAANLSSGVYFYKLVTNEFTEVKKMALVK